jgi:hypothetical protein
MMSEDYVGAGGDTNGNMILSPQTTKATTANNFQPDLQLEVPVLQWQQ